jgi:hypothetical protein
VLGGYFGDRVRVYVSMVINFQEIDQRRSFSWEIRLSISLI